MKKTITCMRGLITLLVLQVGLGAWGGYAQAATITSTAAGGTWTAGSTWVGGVAPATGDTVIIAATGGGAVTIAASVTQTAAGSVTVNNGATLTSSGGTITFGALTINSGGTANIFRQLTVLGVTNVSGRINFGSTSNRSRAMVFTGAVSINSGGVWDETNGGANTVVNSFTFSGDFTQNGTFTTGAGTVRFNGTTAQTISGTGPLGFANLRDSNTGGITLARNVTVTSAITGTVTLTSTCPVDYTLTSNGGATVAHSCPPVSVGGVVNTYYPGSGSVAAGATSVSITLGAATGAATPIAQGDMLLIIQMQDATIDVSNSVTYGSVSASTAGKYEYAVASNAVPLTGGTLTISCGVLNSYTSAVASTTSGKHTFQVIRVPAYASATLTSTLTARAWDGSTGGVLALDTTGTLNLNAAAVSVNGMGFRGGAARQLGGDGGANTDYLTLATVNTNGSKGEGIAGTPRYVFTAPGTLTNTGVEGYPNGSHAMGAPANGGGGGTDRDPARNDENTGGGGGANGGAGGQGGLAWCPGFNTTPPLYNCGPNSGGLGGNVVGGLGVSLLTMGGGGGGGTTNNGTGTLAAGLSTSGAAGGGIIMLRAGSLSGSATLNANGSNGDTTVANDGSGGGGGGGVVLVSAASGMGGLTINANGGTGGSNTPGILVTPHGPGGGGGGGVIMTTGAALVSSAAGGSSGVTYNSNVLFGAYGATSGSSGIVNSGLSAATIPGVLLGSAACPNILDHLIIQSSGSGLTCAASPLTVVACRDAACSTSYTAGVSGTLSASGTGMTVNWDGSTGGAAGADFSIALGNSSVVKNVQVATAGAVKMSISSPSPTPVNATVCNFGTNAGNNDCVFTANTAGFIFANSTTGSTAYSIPALTSGIAKDTTNLLWLRAVQASTVNAAVCTPAIIGQKVDVNMGYACNDPTSCQTGSLGVINGMPIASAGTAVSLTFDTDGAAPITSVRYDDVGKITLTANQTVTPVSGGTAITLNGSSNAFVTAPHHFGFSAISAAPIKAGNNFAATVTAYNGLATPTATANFGQESSPEGVTLSFTKCQPTGTNSSSGSFGGSVGTFGGGAASATNLTWSEVGNIDMIATLTSGNYLGSTLTATGNSGTGGTVCNGASGAGNVGRFIPDHFDTVVTGPMTCLLSGLTCPAGGLVYSGQAFTTNVYARNAAGGPTQNYDGTTNTSPNFAKAVTLYAWDGIGSTTTQNPPSATPGSITGTSGAIAAASFSKGTTAVSPGIPGAPIYAFGTTPTTPTDIYIRAIDTDSVTSLRATNPTTTSVEGGVKVVSGRITLANAYGSELLPLSIVAAAQYYNAAGGWVISSTDSTTQFNTNLSGAGGNVSATIVDASHGLGLADISVVSPGVVSFANGTRKFSLAAPGKAGSVDLSIITAPGYLLPSTTGRATFGIYKSNSGYIYRRENY